MASERRDDNIGVQLEASIDHWRCRLTVAFGLDLRVTLGVQNDSVTEASFEAALHTYLAVSDIEAVTVEGLERWSFIDQTSGGIERGAETTPVTFRGEVDRIYLGGDGGLITVRDAGRTVTVASNGSRSTIVWNPGIERPRALPDLGEMEWRHLICVETANVRSDAVSLAPGARAALTASLRLGA